MSGQCNLAAPLAGGLTCIFPVVVLLMPSTPLFARCWPVLAVVSLLMVAPSAFAQRVSARDKAAAEVLNERMAAAEKRYRDALVLSANSDPKGTAEGDAALEDMEDVLDACIKQRGCQVHTSVMLSNVDIKIFKKLGVQLTSEPVYEHKKLYY